MNTDVENAVMTCPQPQAFPRLKNMVAFAHAAHQQPHRRYHAWSHIQAVLTACATHVDHLDNPDDMWLALLFHDAVYDPSSSHNEKDSWLLARPWTVDAKVDAVRVEHFIMLTAAHGQAPSPTGDDAWMLDLDAGVLGSPPEVYARYAQGVRDEYLTVVSARAYNVGRAGFLKRMLAQDHLFHTAWMRQHRESQARENLRREWRALPWWARALGMWPTPR